MNVIVDRNASGNMNNATVLKFLLSLRDCHEHNQDASFHFVYILYLVIDQQLFSFYLFVQIGISISPS